MSFREKLLIAAETGLPRRKELLVHLGLIEARHRPAVETERARRHDQVRALQAGVAFCGDLDHLRVALEELRHSRIVRKQVRQVDVELQIVRDDDRHRGGHRLFDIERGERGSKPFLGFRGAEKREARGARIRAGRTPFEQLVEIVERRVGDRPRLPLHI